jgi:tripartite-type tricarboxylate transporter receptor subunit TctC
MTSARVLLSMVLVLGAADLMQASLAQAQPYPNKPIKLVVGFPAGGATDTTARLIAQRMQTALGQTVVVENLGGAGGVREAGRGGGAALGPGGDADRHQGAVMRAALHTPPSS